LIKTLNGFEASDLLRISASWCVEEDFAAMKQLLPTPIQDDEVNLGLSRAKREWGGLTSFSNPTMILGYLRGSSVRRETI
jgi:hypothetical protein